MQILMSVPVITARVMSRPLALINQEVIPAHVTLGLLAMATYVRVGQLVYGARYYKIIIIWHPRQILMNV